MRELRDLLARLRPLRRDLRQDRLPDRRQAPHPAALATVVEVEGSSYRREGARMLLEPGRAPTGVLSGGCLESDLEAAAKTAIAENRPRLVLYDLQAETEAIWGFGLGCAGKVTILVEPLAGIAAERLELALATPLEARRELRLATITAVATGGDTAPRVGDYLWTELLERTSREEGKGKDNKRKSKSKKASIEGERQGATVVERAAAATSSDPATRAQPALADDQAPATPLLWKPLSLSFSFSSSPSSSSSFSSLSIFSADLLEFVAAALAGLRPGEARSVRFAGGAAGGEASLLLESLLPPPHLVVVGGERDVAPLLRLGGELGWQTTVVDPRGLTATRERISPLAGYLALSPRELGGAVELDSRTAVVVATHRYLDDLAFLGELADSAIGYLGVLGPVLRRERLLADLEKLGRRRDAGALARLCGPAGLALGGRSPEEVALSIAAEIQAALTGARGGPLSAAAPQRGLAEAEAAERCGSPTPAPESGGR